MTPAPTLQPFTGHVSIDTAELARSIDFYRALFAREPVLARHDYARFGPAGLGLVLGLNARRPSGAGPSGTGPVQHLGLLFEDAGALRAARERLAAAGFETSGAEHVECCYAELDQYWATDPSGVRWELFLAHQEVLASPGESERATGCCAPSCCP